MKEKRRFHGQILVIDDEGSIRKILFMILTDLGYDVKIAENGEEGIALFNEIPHCDLVITDISMPGKDGNEVAQHVRNSHRSEIPLVAMTAFPHEIKKELFNFLLIKPFRLEDLQTIIKSLAHNGSNENLPSRSE